MSGSEIVEVLTGDFTETPEAADGGGLIGGKNRQPEEKAIIFDSIRIRLASPEKIREWSCGEVKKPETINYRTLKPEKDGLFCERIFGPNRDWECHCGKYKRIRYKGIVCDRCGVEVTKSKVRRERMGHIELAAPVSHIWYFRGIPSRMGAILSISPRALEKVLYFASYVVLDPGEADLEYKQILSDKEYRDAVETYGKTAFRADMGAAAIKELLAAIDLDKEAEELKNALKELNGAKTGQKKGRLIKKLEVIEAFRISGNDPTWMIMDAVPVIPPELRPMVQLDGGRFATSDLNDLYRRVINRNNRLKRLLDLEAPDIIVRNEKRMLQEAVDALIDNGRRGRPVMGPGNRALKSLSDLLKGKQGRFRQNLLGKRVDYSGRSVIVVGPNLRMYQCGLPKEMAIELFKPFVMKKLVSDNKAHNIKSAKRMVERLQPEVWDVLESVIKEHPVMLNRAPTLHRLGIQAFEPVLVEGKALKLHPLVCTAYNADFDGDQMAVHVPLSVEAQAECRFLLLAPNNLLKLSDGAPVAVPSQDMVLGIYYLTLEKDSQPGEGMIFSTEHEAMLAYDNGAVSLHAKISVRRTLHAGGLKIKVDGRELFAADLLDPQKFDTENKSGEELYAAACGAIGIKDGEKRSAIVKTTVGRIIFNEAVPQDIGFIDRRQDVGEKSFLRLFAYEIDFVTGKKQLSNIIKRCINRHGSTNTSEMLDKVKSLGFKYSTRGALTVSAADMVVPDDKPEILAESETQVDNVERMYHRGLLTEEERHKNIIKIWTRGIDRLAVSVVKSLDPFNSIRMMADSGARGSIAQIRQLTGMRGLMASPSGDTIEVPVKSNFREGLSVLEYYSSAHGARKGLTDTALKTADSGYLTRRLVDVSQDIIIREWDCVGGKEAEYPGVWVSSFMDFKRVDLRVDTAERVSRIEGLLDFVAAEDIPRDSGKGALIRAGENFTEEHIEALKTPAYQRVGGVLLRTELIEPLSERIRGRWAINTVEHPDTGEVLVKADSIITPDAAENIEKAGISRVYIRTILTCRSKHGLCAKCYGANMGSGRIVRVGEAVGIIAAQSIGEPGTQLTMRTFHTGGVATNEDITQGLPRVEELFEARKPKGIAIISEITGRVRINDTKRNSEVVVENLETGESAEYLIPFGARIKVHDGDSIEAGDPLTEGNIYPQEILKIKGVGGVQDYMIKEVQRVYRLQGVDINDKHIEVIVRQMLRRVRIEENGDTDFLPGSQVDWLEFEDLNDEAQKEGIIPAKGSRILLGITKASLATDSFLSAASFQETTRVLTEASIKGKIDPLVGLKENVIIGKLIPAGSGTYSDIEIISKTPAHLGIIGSDSKLTDFIDEDLDIDGGDLEDEDEFDDELEDEGFDDDEDFDEESEERLDE
ncbi:MAG: DNA-directed RNA polymerase subunit beta' [Clostridiales bacterium]|jgi:DNA-directed RNA polymerase subunit beta'|nr:DNA-directed RNA polymerase subunit beta' [Clostridiales bacterium]